MEVTFHEIFLWEIKSIEDFHGKDGVHRKIMVLNRFEQQRVPSFFMKIVNKLLGKKEEYKPIIRDGYKFNVATGKKGKVVRIDGRWFFFPAMRRVPSSLADELNAVCQRRDITGVLPNYFIQHTYY